MDKITRETAMAKFMLAKKRKQEMVEKVEQHLKETYEAETGKKANYVFSM